jgi:integrase
MPRAPAGRRERSVEACFARFCRAEGLDDPAPSHLLIEAFCAKGLTGRAPATKGTYRSVLRQRSEVVLPVFRPAYRGADAKAPYSDEERADLVAIASAQPQPWRGEAALVILALGIGAGLSAAEIVASSRSDIEEGAEGAVVTVAGTRPRRVEVRPPYAPILLALATRPGSAHLFHPGDADRNYRNFVNHIALTLRADPNAPHLSVARCRSSYICDRLEEHWPLADLLTATGIREVESLLRYARHVTGAPKTKAGLRARLAAGR